MLEDRERVDFLSEILTELSSVCDYFGSILVAPLIFGSDNFGARTLANLLTECDLTTRGDQTDFRAH